MGLKFHEWNQSDFSAKFSGVSTAAEFESKWLEEMSSGSTRPDSAPDKPKHIESCSPTSSLPSQTDLALRRSESKSPASVLSSQADRGVKRKRSESKSSTTLSQATSHTSLQSISGLCVPSEVPSPSKRCKFIKEGIDERIERSRKGNMQ